MFNCQQIWIAPAVNWILSLLVYLSLSFIGGGEDTTAGIFSTFSSSLLGPSKKSNITNWKTLSLLTLEVRTKAYWLLWCRNFGQNVWFYMLLKRVGCGVFALCCLWSTVWCKTNQQDRMIKGPIGGWGLAVKISKWRHSLMKYNHISNNHLGSLATGLWIGINLNSNLFLLFY